MATQSDVVIGCYERFVLGHEAVAIKGELGGKKSDEKSQETDLGATDDKKAFFWTQRFAVKAHQGPVKCIKVSVTNSSKRRERETEREREEVSFSVFGVYLPAHRRVYSTVLSVTSIVPQMFSNLSRLRYSDCSFWFVLFFLVQGGSGRFGGRRRLRENLRLGQWEGLGNAGAARRKRDLPGHVHV